jgi:hypothetical protein
MPGHRAGVPSQVGAEPAAGDPSWATGVDWAAARPAIAAVERTVAMASSTGAALRARAPL